MTPFLLDAAQWLGCITGVAGSGLLAGRTRLSGWGFVVYLVSNVCWIAYAVATSAHGLLAMQCVFTAISIVGVWRWLVAPALTTSPRHGQAEPSQAQQPQST